MHKDSEKRTVHGQWIDWIHSRMRQQTPHIRFYHIAADLGVTDTMLARWRRTDPETVQEPTHTNWRRIMAMVNLWSVDHITEPEYWGGPVARERGFRFCGFGGDA